MGGQVVVAPGLSSPCRLRWDEAPLLQSEPPDTRLHRCGSHGTGATCSLIHTHTRARDQHPHAHDQHSLIMKWKFWTGIQADPQLTVSFLRLPVGRSANGLCFKSDTYESFEGLKNVSSNRRSGFLLYPDGVGTSRQGWGGGEEISQEEGEANWGD